MLRNMRAYVDGLPDKSNEMAAIDDIFSISYLHFPAIFERLDDPKERLSNDVMNALVTLPMLALVFAPKENFPQPRTPSMLVTKTYFLQSPSASEGWARSFTNGLMFHQQYAPFYNKLEHPLVIPVSIYYDTGSTQKQDPRNHFVVLTYHPPKETFGRQNELVVYESLNLDDYLHTPVEQNKRYMDLASDLIAGFRKGTLHGGLPPPSRHFINTPTQEDARSCGLFAFANTMRACGLWSDRIVCEFMYPSRRTQFRMYLSNL